MNDVKKPQTIILIIYVDFTISMLFYEWFISSLNRDNLFLIDCWVVRRRSTKPRQNDQIKCWGGDHNLSNQLLFSAAVLQ